MSSGERWNQRLQEFVGHAEAAQFLPRSGLVHREMRNTKKRPIPEFRSENASSGLNTIRPSSSTGSRPGSSLANRPMYHNTWATHQALSANTMIKRSVDNAFRSALRA